MSTFENLKKIYDNLNNEVEDEDYRWEPVRPDDQKETPSFNIVESRAPGAKTKLRNKLSYILSFIDSIKHIRYSDGCTIMPIPIYSRRNIRIWGSPRNVLNAIGYMVSIGLITQETKANKFKHLASTYRYYKENEDKFKEYCEERGIVKGRYTGSISIGESCNIDPKIVRFKSKTYLKKPDNMSEVEFMEYLTLCLRENYPLFNLWKNKIDDEINPKFYSDYPEIWLMFEPHFHWSKTRKSITKIGIRLTSSLNNTRKEDRGKIMEKYGFKYVHDIVSSIPRVTYSLNHGKWCDEDIDFYKLMFDEIEPNGEWNDEKREVIKQLCLRCIFEPSGKSAGSHIYKKIKNTKALSKNETYKSIEKFRDAIVKVVGGRTYDNEVFLAESIVYLMTLYDFLYTYTNVWLLYDAFYSEIIPDVEEEIVDFKWLVESSIKNNFAYFIKLTSIQIA